MAKTSKQKATSDKPPVGAKKQSQSSPKQPAQSTRTQRPQVDKDEKDKAVAAAHEAGHFVVALVQGFVVRAGIWKTESKKWIGQTQVLGDLSTPAAFVAGLVAQWMWDAPDDDWLSDDYQSAFNIALRSNPEIHTAIDIKVFPKSREEREAAIGEAVKILRNHWEFFEWTQRQLDNKGSIDVEEVVDYCRQHRSLKWVRLLEQAGLTADEWGRGVTKQARTKKVTTPKKKPKAKHQQH
jgi:hypothetical protein